MAVATAPQPHAAAKSAAVAANPFTRAAKRKTETFLDQTRNLSASAQTLNQIDVPATGFLRHIVLNFDVTGITDTATLRPDAPWNLIDNVTFRDVNGQPLHVLSGYELFLANLFGAYTQNADPRKSVGYSASATGTEVSFSLRIPVEIIARGALGCLDNTNAAMLYKIAVTLAPRDTVFNGETGTPTVRLRGVVESWSNPSGADVHGVPNEKQPPALGTTQNWSSQTAPVLNGQTNVRLSRVGNSIRNLVFVLRDSTGARVDSWPDELALYFDGNQWHKAPTNYFKRRMVELYGYAPADLPAGVIVLPFTDDFDGTPGEEMGDFWVQTSGATRFELQASFAGSAAAGGSLGILTNDVLAIAGASGPGATLGSQG